MKRYNRANKKWFIWGLVLPILLFFVVVNVTYAYFTASASQKGSAATPVITLRCEDGTSTINSKPITGSTKLIPGETLAISGKISNAGTADVYAIITFKINITKQDGSKETAVSKYYSLENSKLREIKGTATNYSYYAFEILQGAKTSTFGVEHLFRFNKYNNSYQNALVEYELSAEAVQKDGIDTNIVATDILMSEHKSSIKQLSGVSVLNGTPTPDSPAEIKSVGNKSKNLLRFKGLTQVHKQLGDKTQPLTGLDEQQLYFGNGTGVFFSLPSAPGTGHIFEVGDNYVSWSTGTAYRGPAYSVKIKPNTQYKYSHKDENGNYVRTTTVTVMHYNAEGVLVASLNLGYKSQTEYNAFTTPADAAFTLVNLRANNKDQVYTYYDLQLEEGDTVTPYEEFGYKIPITQNIPIDKKLEESYWEQGTFSFNNGAATPAESTTRLRSKDLIPITPNVDYCISIQDNNYCFINIILCDNKGNHTSNYFNLNSAIKGATSLIVNFPSTCFYIRFVLSNKNDKLEIKPSEIAKIKPKMQRVDGVVEYFSIKEYLCLNEPLRSIGDVADYIDLETGKVVRQIKEMTLNGSENWTKYTASATNSYFITNNDFKQGFQMSKCNLFENIDRSWSKPGVNCYSDYSGYSRKYFQTTNNSITTVDEWKTWLSENNIQLVYVSTDIRTETINLPDLSWLDANRELTIDTEVQPKIIYNY